MLEIMFSLVGQMLGLNSWDKIHGNDGLDIKLINEDEM